MDLVDYLATGPCIKIREVHNLNVSRNLVYAMMEEVDPEGLEERSCVGKRKRPPKGAFTSKVY